MSSGFDFPSLVEKLKAQQSKIFYKDIEMICNPYMSEWKTVLENNVEKYGAPYICLFTFSIEDSVYIIKQKTGETEETTYDICEKFTREKTRRLCREYKAYAFFTCAYFEKYIATTFGGHCSFKIVPTGDVFSVMLSIKLS